MTQTEFLTRLANQLIAVPLEERRAALDFYQNYFQDARDEGKTEAEIIASLDAPELIASRIRAEFAYTQAKRNPSDPRTAGRVLAAIFGVLSLPVTLPVAIVVLAVGVTVAALLFAVFLTAACAVAACCAAAIGLGFHAAVLLFTGAGTGAMLPTLLGMVLVAIGLAILLIVLFLLVLKLLVRLIAWIGRGIYRLFAKKEGTRDGN